MNIKLTSLIFSFTLISQAATAAELCGILKQGEILTGKTTQGSQAMYQGKNLYTDAKGIFLLAFGRDEKSTSEIIFIGDDMAPTAHKLTIANGNWDIQNITGVPPRKVTPPDSDLRDIEFEQKSIRTALETKNPYPFWQKGFIQPVEGRISGKFGGQRIMNNVKRNPHAGMDIAAPAGTPIKSASDGKIVLAAPNLFYSGNVVVVDHGYGLHTIYAHMQEIHVKQGDEVKQGDILGLVGSTGRSTGPHLHWGASLNGTKFQPLSLLNINKNNDFCFNL